MLVAHSIAVIGGTGPQGRGLAYRFALAGHRVVIGSRSTERASATAEEINTKLEVPTVWGTNNADALATSDLVLLAVPWAGHTELVQDLAGSLGDKIVISCVNPLGFDSAGPFGLMLSESAAEETQRLIPSARVVGAFHHVAAKSLWVSEEPLRHEDVLVCGDDVAAKAIVMKLASSVTGKVGVDAGALRMTRKLEPLTAVLIGLNKTYKTRVGIAITGVDPRALA